MNHLNEAEIQLLLENKKLNQIKAVHFESCSHCKNIFNQQKVIHSKLNNIVPEKASELLTKKVLEQVSSLKNFAYTQKAKKHDWWFIGSLIILVLTSIYFVFIGGDADKSGAGSRIVENISKKINIDSFLNFLTFQVFDISIFYFVVLGVIAATFYLFFDRYIQKFVYKLLHH